MDKKTLNAMLKHAKKKMMQRVNKPIAKHSGETFKKAFG